MPLLFRQLHTIKGNARVYGLSFISSEAHQVENLLSKFLTNDYNKDYIGEKEHDYDVSNSLVQEIYSLQGQINQYIKSAKEVFSLEFKEDLKFKEKLHDLIKSLEYWVSKLSTRDDSKTSNFSDYSKETIDSIKNNHQRLECIEELENISHSIKGLARGIDERELSQKVHLLESGISYLKDNEVYSHEQYHEYFIEPINDVRKIGKDIFVKSSQFQNLQLDADYWSVLISDISLISLKLMNKEYIENKDIIQDVYHIHSKVLTVKGDFFPTLFRYLYDLIESNVISNESKHKKIIFALNEIWQFIIIIFQLDLYKIIPPNDRLFFLESFLRGKV